MSSSRSLFVLALIATLAATLTLSGCELRAAHLVAARAAGGDSASAVASAGVGSIAASASVSGAATGGSATGAATSPEGGGGASGSKSTLSTAEAGAIDAELSAIQSELDRLKVPDDSDFNGIGSGLK